MRPWQSRKHELMHTPEMGMQCDGPTQLPNLIKRHSPPCPATYCLYPRPRVRIRIRCIWMITTPAAYIDRAIPLRRLAPASNRSVSAASACASASASLSPSSNTNSSRGYGSWVGGCKREITLAFPTHRMFSHWTVPPSPTRHARLMDYNIWQCLDGMR
ncbi:hypothetical protein BHE74_00041016 [Ensete ventricosum]|uniref:Uncharacterized protein n=1 Tax=Ensete ventricosum TaxID=4639 RepID=A0A444DKY2_ENSVE|nr:hypothetical protein GW17_00038349 [Ensete ventricosum]RWW52552.1 hypothetical protein BHE74_00041016 [Ensete ventricosum]RZR72371.1 hypothetical protein BHM03_00012941 [Ensete ventricosum]